MAAIARVARPLRSSVLSSPAPPSLPRLARTLPFTVPSAAGRDGARTFRSSAAGTIVCFPRRPSLPPSTDFYSIVMALLTGVPYGTTVREKKYTRDHEWIELSDDGKTGAIFGPSLPLPPFPLPHSPSTPLNHPPFPGTIGISTYAAKSLGDVVYVELPTLEQEVAAGDSIGAVESVKSASDILTPVAGTVVEANAVLEEKPATINSGPEGEGWIARIRVKDGGKEVEGLMGAEEYRKFTED